MKTHETALSCITVYTEATQRYKLCCRTATEIALSKLQVILFRETKLWNILPHDLTLEDQSFGYFKKRLYSYYYKALQNIYDTDDNKTWKYLFAKMQKCPSCN